MGLGLCKSCILVVKFPGTECPGLWKSSRDVAWILLEELFGGAESCGKGGGVEDGGGWRRGNG